MSDRRNTFLVKEHISGLPNRWDLLALLIILTVFIALSHAARQMAMPYQVGEILPISLDPSHLPMYALRTVLRLIIALFFSLLFTFIFAAWAAKSRRAEKIIIPMIDIFQSVPVLGFLSIAIVSFIHLFPNSLLGPECAVIFVIFTSQAWNMALSFYQSLRTVPADFREAAAMFQLSAWQRFWRVDVPYAMPGLLWNMMLSMSGSWFFIVFSEAITIADQRILLPGIGSYIAEAIIQTDIRAEVYAIIAMLIVILLYDQLLFRPLLYWAERFKVSQTIEEDPASAPLLTELFHRVKSLHWIRLYFHRLTNVFINNRFCNHKLRHKPTALNNTRRYWHNLLWNIGLFMVIGLTLYSLYRFIQQAVTLHEVLHVLFLGLITTCRVAVLLVVASLIWVPLGVWIGMNSRATRIVQPIVQFLAAFPANLFYPLFVIVILTYHLNVNIWVTPLMILGSQWYVLFNVIAGASTLPKDLYFATANFGVRGFLWWRKLVLPGIFPFYVTGAMTAAGGAWNASIAAEVVSWGKTQLVATGLGAYITQYTTKGDFQRIALGVAVMCFYVLLLNRLLWKPLYTLAEERYSLTALSEA
ncbi:MAG: gbuB [Gammaproteobacteria bacterium]|jgi:NitT/TauT family transport system permease protein|nr:gbuB [Gammaproteobacteria bacterium]